MAQDQVYLNVNKTTLEKMVANMLIDSLPDKKLMAGFLTRIIMKGNNGTDFLMAYTDSFPKINFGRGDIVRVELDKMYWNIDIDKSIEQGYIIDEGIYIRITSTDYTCSSCYTGIATFIDPHGQVSQRELEFDNSIILMDNTIMLSNPTALPGDLI